MFIEQQNLRIYPVGGIAVPHDGPGEPAPAAAQHWCIHLHNTAPDETGVVTAAVWVELASPSDHIEVDVGFTPGGLGDSGDLLADAAAALASVEFSRPLSLADALVLPAPLSAGAQLAVWVRLTVNAGTEAPAVEHCLIVFSGAVG